MLAVWVVGGPPSLRRLVADELERSPQVRLVGVSARHPRLDHVDPHTVSVLHETDHAAVATTVSAREVEVLTWLARGCTNNQVAAALYVSPETVKTHLRHLFRKLDVADRHAAVARAFELGLLDERTCWQAGDVDGPSTVANGNQAQEERS